MKTFVMLAAAIFGLSASASAARAEVPQITTNLPAGATCEALVFGGKIAGYVCKYGGHTYNCTGIATGCVSAEALTHAPTRRTSTMRSPLVLRPR